MSKDYSIYQHYRLLKDIPLCPAGTIFYSDPTDGDRGSYAAGCLKLAWLEGMCQNSLCGDTIVFHAKAIEESGWFIPVHFGYVQTLAKLQTALGRQGTYLDPSGIEKQVPLFLIDKNEDVRRLASLFHIYLEQVR